MRANLQRPLPPMALGQASGHRRQKSVLWDSNLLIHVYKRRSQRYKLIVSSPHAPVLDVKELAAEKQAFVAAKTKRCSYQSRRHGFIHVTSLHSPLSNLIM